MTEAKKQILFCDFDGTIIEEDIGRIMVPQLSPEWWSKVKEIYPLVLSGSMGPRSWYYWKFLHAQIDASEYVNLVDSVEVTPGFMEFHETVRKSDGEFIILSDGFESYIRMVLEKLGISDQLFYCNTMNIDTGNPKIDFPYLNIECGYCGVCKAGLIASYVEKGYESVFIGDGLSDIFAAYVSHRVFAKGRLAEQCEREGIAFTPFQDFHDIMPHYAGRFDVERHTPSSHHKCVFGQTGRLVFDVSKV